MDKGRGNPLDWVSRQKEVQWMRKMRFIMRLWCIIGWRREKEDFSEGKGAGHTEGSDLHLPSVLPYTNSLPFHSHFTYDCVEMVISVLLGGLEEHKRDLKVRNGCGDQNFYIV